MELDWKALARFLPSSGTPKFGELVRHAGDSDGDEISSDDMQRVLSELPETDLLPTLTEMLKSEVGEILRVSPDKIDPNRSIYDMGLDSLMGVELVVALESRFGIRLPVMALSQSPTIAKLAERIIQQLKGNVEIDAASDKKEIIDQVKQLASQHGTEVSAESIAGLTKDIQSPKTLLTGRMSR
jgi:acyl carrier protein